MRERGLGVVRAPNEVGLHLRPVRKRNAHQIVRDEEHRVEREHHARLGAQIGDDFAHGSAVAAAELRALGADLYLMPGFDFEGIVVIQQAERVLQVVQRQAFALGQRVIARHHAVFRIGEQCRLLQFILNGNQLMRRDDGVQLAGEQAIHQLRGRRQMGVDVERRIERGERIDGVVKHPVAFGKVVAEREAAVFVPGDLLTFRYDALKLLDGGAHALLKALTGGGERNGAVAADEQGKAQLFFKRGDLVGDGGLRHKQRLRGTGKALIFGNRQKTLDLLLVQRACILPEIHRLANGRNTALFFIIA